MTFLEEIAQRIDKALDGDCGYGVGKHLAEQLSPLIAEHDAELIEKLADKIRHKQHAESIRQMLREKARQRREESDRV